MKFEPIPEYCDLIPINEFDPRLFTDYDGNGYWATKDEMSRTSIFAWDGERVVYSKVLKWATHIAWFNK